MRVRMTQQVSGSRNGRRWPVPGEELEVSDAEGAQLCASGIAAPVATRAEPETRPARRRKPKAEQ